jgi:hypothetical protein
MEAFGNDSKGIAGFGKIIFSLKFGKKYNQQGQY